MAERQNFPLTSGTGFAAVIHGNIVHLTAGTRKFNAYVYAFPGDGNLHCRTGGIDRLSRPRQLEPTLI